MMISNELPDVACSALETSISATYAGISMPSTGETRNWIGVFRGRRTPPIKVSSAQKMIQTPLC